MNNKEKYELIEQLLIANSSQSNRVIAWEVEVSPPTVARIRKRLEASGRLEHATEAVGRDGKHYQATKKSRKPVRTTTCPWTPNKYYVYLIHAISTEYYKIGIAVDVEYRLVELQVGCPFELKLIGYIEVESKQDARRCEMVLHHEFRKFRVRGEWFELSFFRSKHYSWNLAA